MERTPVTRRLRDEGGFAYVEVICCIVVLALALLGHASSTLAEHQMGEVGQARKTGRAS